MVKEVAHQATVGSIYEDVRHRGGKQKDAQLPQMWIRGDKDRYSRENGRDTGRKYQPEFPLHQEVGYRGIQEVERRGKRAESDERSSLLDTQASGSKNKVRKHCVDGRLDPNR